ncbi:SpoIIE family protein phosphatase (plasmid) [Streptomyces atratus]|uniref:SpoIIE family protein phosphatase n=1 Tax=Streptomyces atratus TaxID=1893 RepID=UPI00386476DD
MTTTSDASRSGLARAVNNENVDMSKFWRSVLSSLLPSGWHRRSRREVPHPGTGQPTPSAGEREVPHRSPGRRWCFLPSPRSAASQVFLLQLAVVVLLVAATVAALVVQAGRQGTEHAREEVLAVGEAFANSPGVVEALDGPNPTAELQPLTKKVQQRSELYGIVVSTPDGIRLAHPDPGLIGKHVIGPYKAAAKGKAFTEIVEVGPSVYVYAAVPVFRPDGSVAGIVYPEITLENVNKEVGRQLPMLFGAAGGALILAAGGSALVSRRLRRQTHGLGPVEMTRMYEHHDAVLHSVREGVLIIDADGRLLLANDETRRLLGLPADAERRDVGDLGLDGEMARVLSSGEAITDEVHLTGDRLLAVNIRPTALAGGPSGSVVTLRDTTELAALTGRAEVARERLKLLYDAGVRIGTTLEVVRTAEELTEVAVPRFADTTVVDLLDSVVRGQEPARETRRQMRRTAIDGEPEARTLYPVGELITFLPMTPQMRAMESGRAVLEADLRQARGWQEQDPDRARRALEYGFHSLVTVPLQARGVVLGMVSFWRTGNSPAFDEEDLSFAEELAARAAVALDNARRFTREHAMAVTLQRSLLPRGLPKQDAVEVAWRYLPAEAGVGGDWFDVIPLSGARVALVVGDVVGHGLHAAATMGRLRTAVHNFSALDMAPDELLAHLDDLVTRIDSEESTGEGSEDREGEAVTGATCLYAIYDPVTGLCTVARAGHPGPAVVHPDGTVTYPDVPASPPLGVGGHPFETAELRLPEGSHLVLFTDGLVESRDRDIETGLNQLRRALEGGAGRTPEETCRAAIEARLPTHPSDDIALLVARTRLLAPSKVAEWDVPPDPAAVATVRAECAVRLREWGLEDIGFTTELILSELITNAIRYGTPPIRARLLHNRSLICEVSDGSSTSPHLRLAKTTDEGGRGLFLVAQFTQRWGTRYTPRGKVIWTEQPLHDGAAAAATGDTLADVLLDQFDDPAH